MDDLVFVLSIFAAGFACGYFVRDVISKRRHRRFQEVRRARRSRRYTGLTSGITDASSNLRNTPGIGEAAKDQTAAPPFHGGAPM
jgi:hypothetical protein